MAVRAPLTKHFDAVAATGLFLLALFGLIPAQAATPEIPAVRLTQRHFYWGETETTVSKLGVRISNQGRQKFTLVASSPAWVVTIYRDDDRTYISEPLKLFEANGIVSTFVLNRPERNERYGSLQQKTKIFNRTVEETRGDREVFAKLPLSNIAAPEVERIINTTYKVPTDDGIPVLFTKKLKGKDRMSGMEVTGQIRVYLTTTKIENIHVSPSFFAAPTGYRLCKSKQEVLLSKANREASGDFDQMFEVGKNSRKNK